MEIMPVYPTNLIKKNRFCNSHAPYYFAVLPELWRDKIVKFWLTMWGRTARASDNWLIISAYLWTHEPCVPTVLVHQTFFTLHC